MEGQQQQQCIIYLHQHTVCPTNSYHANLDRTKHKTKVIFNCMLKKERNTIQYRRKHWKFSLVITYGDGFVLLHETGNTPCSWSMNVVAGQQQSILNLNTSSVINTLECYMCNGSSIVPGSNIQLNNSSMGKYPDNSYYTSATTSSRYAAGHCWQSKNEKVSDLLLRVPRHTWLF